MLNTLETLIATLNDAIWGYILVYFLILTGLFFTYRLRFIQFTHFRHMASLVLKSRNQSGSAISSFQALCTTLAARVGTGNLAGVAVAITLGGPGAVFWMWVTALVGMATAFAECSLAQLYKVKQSDGSFKGGPAYYMMQGAKNPTMALLYSGCLFFGYGFVFSTVQSNTIADAVSASTPLSPLIIGIAVTVLSGVIIFGGLKSIAKFAELVVPFMAVAYLLITLIIMGMNAAEIPRIIMLILTDAFGFQEAGAGFIGAAMIQGIKRGLYSNEAGTGSAPNAAAAAIPSPNHPASQGFVQMFGVVIDTLIVCSCTAFLILLSGVDEHGKIEGIRLTQQALVSQVGPWGADFLTIIIFFFCFTSIVANYAYAEMNLRFVKLDGRWGKLAFQFCFLTTVLIGSIATLPQVIALADLSFGLMALVNLTALFLLWKVVVHLANDYTERLAKAQPLDYDVSQETAEKLNIDHHVWPVREK